MISAGRVTNAQFEAFPKRRALPPTVRATTVAAMGEPASKHGDAEAFIERWTERAGGSERANYALFIVELCDLLGVGRPDPAGEETERNDYVFERAVRFRHDDGSTSPGRIDLYKKGCFVLEAKQSKKREKGGEVYEQIGRAHV